jgi:hypothetical protein
MSGHLLLHETSLQFSPFKKIIKSLIIVRYMNYLIWLRWSFKILKICLYNSYVHVVFLYFALQSYCGWTAAGLLRTYIFRRLDTWNLPRIGLKCSWHTRTHTHKVCKMMGMLIGFMVVVLSQWLHVSDSIKYIQFLSIIFQSWKKQHCI